MEWLDQYRASLSAQLPNRSGSYDAEVARSSPSYYLHDVAVGGDVVLICSYGDQGERYWMASVDKSGDEPRLEPESQWTEVERTFVAKNFAVKPDADGFLLEDGTFVRPLELHSALRERASRARLLLPFPVPVLSDPEPKPKPEEPATKTASAAETASQDAAGVYAFTKATAEKRYTFGPLYAPDRLDAHGEYVESEVLQSAVWDYVRQSAGEGRRLKLQHGTVGKSDLTIGEWVEVVAWPYETEVQITVPGTDEVRKVTLPADTVYMGVVWDEEAWPLVKAGKIAGLSMGGRAVRVQGASDVPELRMGGSGDGKEGKEAP